MGKSLLWVMLCAACANNVPADRSTGPDGRPKGAKEVVLENGVGRQRDIVTYPGGDRVDWKKITLPAKASGRLDLKMTYTTPRPDLKASIDVFDQWFQPVKEAASGRGRAKSLTIAQATGTYFIRVWAPRRTDAATYVIEATFEPDKGEEPFPGDKVVVSDPPRLPPVPEPDAAPPTTPPVTTPPVTTPPVTTPPVVTTPTPPPATPVIARILTKEIQNDGTIIVTLGAGSEHGIGKEWTKGSLLKGDTRDPKAKYPNGTITVIQVNKNTTKVRLRQGITSDVLKDNDKVVLEP